MGFEDFSDGGITMININQSDLLVGTSMALAIVAGFVAGDVMHFIVALSQRPIEANDLESSRRQLLKRNSWMMDYFEPLAIEFGNLQLLQNIANIQSIRKNLPRSGEPTFWRAEEYLGAYAVRAIAMTVCVLVPISLVVNVQLGILVGAAIGGYLILGTAKSLSKKSNKRLRRFKRQIPFAIDLMALIMESGGDLRQGMQSAIDQNQNHPTGEELAIVLGKMNGGMPLVACLEEMRDRLADEDVSELVFSIRNAEQLGVPLSKTLLTLAEQMRSKQIQAYEKLIGQRKVMIVFPGMVVMFACLLVVIAPMAKDIVEGLPQLLGL